MRPGSFWTQPAGGVHITAAKGGNSLAYIEVEDAFGVLPSEKAFQSEAKPINVDISNIVWINLSGMPTSSDDPKIAFLWGDPINNGMHGTLVKLPAGFTGTIHSYAATFRAVVIQGQLQYQVPNENDVKTLEPGSYFSAKGTSVHRVSSDTNEVSVIYVRTNGKFEVLAPKIKN